MRFSFILLLATFIASSCNNQFSYRDISEFSIDTSVLHNGDSVEIIYSSGGPMDETSNKHLFHVVAVSLKTNDTINLLSYNISPVKIGGRDLQFIDPYSPINRLHNYPDVKNIKDLENIPVKFPQNIVRNNEHPEFYFAKKYPAIVGSLGHVYHRDQWDKFGN